MNNRYEALLVLNTSGKEDTVKDVVERLELHDGTLSVNKRDEGFLE